MPEPDDRDVGGSEGDNGSEEQPPLRSAGAEPGVDPTPESIRQGTVRMEEHPDFPRVVEELDGLGFSLVEDRDGPRVAIRRVVDQTRTIIARECEVRVVPGMRFIDLEHELGHVRQMTDPGRFPDGPPDSEVELQRSNGNRKPLRNVPDQLAPWQDVIVEYHVRLQEYIRLAERGVDDEILAEHAKGVDEHQVAYRERGLGHPSMTRGRKWVQQHFGDISELSQRVNDLRGQ